MARVKYTIRDIPNGVSTLTKYEEYCLPRVDTHKNSNFRYFETKDEQPMYFCMKCAKKTNIETLISYEVKKMEISNRKEKITQNELMKKFELKCLNEPFFFPTYNSMSQILQKIDCSNKYCNTCDLTCLNCHYCVEDYPEIDKSSDLEQDQMHNFTVHCTSTPYSLTFYKSLQISYSS